MRLSHIKLSGFKTFVDPTVIPVPSTLVGVVGPNGCGKSNVIDAVRWVLGESKASALRGDSMQDVIFNGSTNRKSVGRASVELVFDNSLGKAGGKWSEYAEISIKRVLLRGGDSTYYMNNIHVRRRDIADVFFGTGIGGHGYAIIEQGMISRVIEAKPEELRSFLEEAAGISKYHARRRETELRLRDTRGNLSRIGDICQELENQLQHLEEQAEVAGKFKDMREKLGVTYNLLWLARKQEARAQRVRREKEIQRLELELEAENSTFQNIETLLEEGRVKHYAASDSLHIGQGELYEANAEVARIEQQIQHLRDNKQRVGQQITVAKNQIKNHEEQLEGYTESLEKWHGEFEKASVKFENNMEQASRENEKLPQTQEDFQLQQKKSKEIQSKLLLTEQARELEESNRTHVKKSLQQLELRRAKLLEEQGALTQPDSSKLIQLQEEIGSIESELEKKQEHFKETEEKLLKAEEAKREITIKKQLLEQENTQMEARSLALERLQNQLENDDGLSEWLTKYKLDVLPRLWQSIQIEKGWENALESVLRERLNSSSLESLEIVQDWLEDSPPGKWTLFETASLVEQELSEKMLHNKKGWKSLEWYLTCEDTGIKSVLKEWLRGIYVVKSIKDGLLQRKDLSLGEILVTPEGHFFTQHSLTYYAPDTQLHGVLVRQREIVKIKNNVEKIGSKLIKQKSSLVAIEKDCAKLEGLISQIRINSEELQRNYHNLQIQALKLTQLAQHSDQRGKQISIELAEIIRQIDIESSQKKELEEKLSEYQCQVLDLQEKVKNEKDKESVAEEILNKQQNHVRNIEKEMQEIDFYKKTCRNKIVDIENAILGIEGGLVEFRSNLDKLETEQNNFDGSALNNQMQECLVLREQKEEFLRTARGILEGVTKDLQKMEQERVASEQKMGPLRESINQVRLKEQEALILEKQFHEKLEESGAKEEELQQILGKTKPSKIQSNINYLDSEIEKLGAVNLAALEELTISKERKIYLDSQFSDLQEAVKTLENVIKRIDRETRERLLDTFDKVNNHLDDIFPAIFGGGNAKLKLSGEEILDSGVEINAQPPGKKNSSIKLLSGGEKALTALALVFSLFKLNPAPFCLLDEVDAPLDDSNTERFCDLLRKMSEQTQCLFISHNKITIELAQQLIGVTMQEQGVSRVVAVDIEEAVRFNKVAEVG